MSEQLYLAELTAWDPSVPGLVTLRYASGAGHVTGPAETPADTYYRARLRQPVSLTRSMFAPGTTQGRSTAGYGDLVLANADGALDALLTYGFSGRSLTIRRGTPGAAYPGGFVTVFTGTMDQPEARGDTITIRVRDKQLDLALPLQPVKYAGNNVLPNGLEGVPGDHQGKPKPICLGSVQNVPAVCVNTSKLIYQVHDGALQSLDSVYDSGIALGTGRVWTLETSTFGANNIYAVVYGSSLFIAAGAAGNLATSPDGVTWTARTSGFGANDIYGLAYGAGLYVAVGVGGNLFTSPDGITWTTRTSQFGGDDIMAVTFSSSLTLFVAVGNNRKVSTSPDGITWTARTAAGFDAADRIRGVTFANGIFVAVSNLGNICTSSSGTTGWTSQVLNGSLNGNLEHVAYGNGRFVVVGSERVITSEDGYTWQGQSNIWGSGVLGLGVVYGTQFVATGATGRLATSTDGLTWTVQSGTTVFGVSFIRKVAYGGGLYVAVGDSGKLALSVSRGYSSTTELVDDAKRPNAGDYIGYLAGGYFRLGAPPAGLVTADASEGASASVRTAGQLFARVLQRAGKAAGDWSASDVTALDTANAAALGYWTADETTFADLLDLIAGSVGAAWFTDQSGVYRIQRLLAPSGPAVLSLTANDLLVPLERVPTNDESQGLPTWRTILRYQRNYSVQTAGLAAAVSDARRAFLALEYREAKSEDRAVLTVHLLAGQTQEDTLFQSASDAALEATRRQVLRGVLRNRYAAVLQLTSETETLDLNAVISLQHSRYGLTAGVLYRVLGVEPDVARRQLTLQLWGPPDPTSLLRLPQLVFAGSGTVT